ncbi:rRNA methyltransferase [Desulfovibrio sp. OttesenSCG-928-G15]|nr:rRNA methyltransferase [Desulfovibrio sp. OttesenSCG-928-G15]
MNTLSGKFCPALSLTTMGHHCISSVLHDLVVTRPELPAGKNGLVCVDATCGNGHDTCFLVGAMQGAGLAAQGTGGVILALDVQARAIASTQKALHGRFEHLPMPVVLLQQDHAQLAAALEAHAPQQTLAAIIYNLGFLPRSDKKIITRKQSTLASLEAAARLLLPGGLIVAHTYGGHPGGSEESAAVNVWFSALPHDLWLAGKYTLCNKAHNPEILFMAQKRRHTEQVEQ